MINKDIFEPKSRNTISNLTTKDNNTKEQNTSKRKNTITSNPILKIANQMENKVKIDDSFNCLLITCKIRLLSLKSKLYLLQNSLTLQLISSF